MGILNRVKQFIKTNCPICVTFWWRLKPYYWKSMQNKFSTIYHRNIWGNDESVSGCGSALQSSTVVRAVLPDLLEEVGAQSLLDASCGDFNWMRKVDLKNCRYYGVDIVPEIIADNQRRYAASNRIFTVLNMAEDILPQADVILCRDCLVHFSCKDVIVAVKNMKKSGATYLLTTTFPDQQINKNILTGHWRPLNLQRPPFNFPMPLKLINEQCTELDGQYPDKSLGLWKFDDIHL